MKITILCQFTHQDREVSTTTCGATVVSKNLTKLYLIVMLLQNEQAIRVPKTVRPR